MLAVLERGHRARAELLPAQQLAEGRGGQRRRQHEPEISVLRDGDVHGHDLPMPGAIEEVRDGGAARLDGLLEGGGFVVAGNGAPSGSDVCISARPSGSKSRMLVHPWLRTTRRHCS